jgi:hypothetical protein
LPFKHQSTLQNRPLSRNKKEKDTHQAVMKLAVLANIHITYPEKD